MKRTYKILIVLFGILLLGHAGSLFYGIYARHHVKPSAPVLLRPAIGGDPVRKAEFKPRVNYNLSLIKNGVTSIEDFKRAIQDDDVLFARFAGFDWEHAQIISLPTMKVFVAFRRSDKILWARRQVTIAEGTYAITDGHQTILMRCGNLISYIPQFPNEDLPPGTLEIPEPPNIEPPITLTQSDEPPVFQSPPQTIGIYTYEVTCCFGGGGIYTKPVATPEPTALQLVVGGSLAGFFVFFFVNECKKIWKRMKGE